MNASEITGVALYAESPDEIVNVISQHLDTTNQDVFAACARGIGHLVRRFRIDVTQLHQRLSVRAKNFEHSRFVLGAIEDMNADMEQFCK